MQTVTDRVMQGSRVHLGASILRFGAIRESPADLFASDILD